MVFLFSDQSQLLVIAVAKIERLQVEGSNANGVFSIHQQVGPQQALRGSSHIQVGWKFQSPGIQKRKTAKDGCSNVIGRFVVIGIIRLKNAVGIAHFVSKKTHVIVRSWLS